MANYVEYNWMTIEWRTAIDEALDFCPEDLVQMCLKMAGADVKLVVSSALGGRGVLSVLRHSPVVSPPLTLFMTHAGNSNSHIHMFGWKVGDHSYFESHLRGIDELCQQAITHHHPYKFKSVIQPSDFLRNHYNVRVQCDHMVCRLAPQDKCALELKLVSLDVRPTSTATFQIQRVLQIHKS
jgi:hypothetical protein